MDTSVCPLGRPLAELGSCRGILPPLVEAVLASSLTVAACSVDTSWLGPRVGPTYRGASTAEASRP